MHQHMILSTGFLNFRSVRFQKAFVWVSSIEKDKHYNQTIVVYNCKQLHYTLQLEEVQRYRTINWNIKTVCTTI